MIRGLMVRLGLLVLVLSTAFAAAARADGLREAESAILDGVEVLQHVGASGGARVRRFDAPGDGIRFDDLEPGRFVRIRYSLGERAERRCTLVADGSRRATVRFQPTGSWDRYATTLAELEVRGQVLLVIEEDDGKANRAKSCAAIDAIEVVEDPPPEVEDMRKIEQRILAPLRATKPRSLSYPGAEHLEKARGLIGQRKTRDALTQLDAWLDLDYRHSNWWVNHVPIPRAVGEIALLLRDEIGEAREARVTQVLHRAWPPPPGGIGASANLFYRVDAAILLALLKRDAGYLRSIFARAAREIRITKKEGIQEDFSFHQHGPQFYSGSYGLEFLRGAVRVATLGRGTGLALPSERMDLLVAFFLDGMQWIVCGDMIDPGAQGRNFSRKSAGRGGRTVAALCEQLLALDPPRSDEFATYASDLSGNRCFWRSDFMVHRRPGWYASTKMASVRTAGTESGNGEGLKQFHLADGACLVMQRGDEYTGIQPVWNWRRIPGITCEQKTGNLPLVNWGRNARGRTKFVGGVSDGEFGVACLDLDRAGVRAHKSWFYFEDEVVCLGAGIEADGKSPISTSVDQRLLRTKVDRGKAAAGAWLHHDGNGYVVLEGSFEVETGKQRGTWKAINRNYGEEVIEKEVFSLRIDHGVKPRGAAYAYVLRPVGTARQTAAYAERPPVRVLANTPAIQAVEIEAQGLRGIVFHQPGTLGDVWVDRPCVLLVRKTASGTQVSLADPAQGGAPIFVAVDGMDEKLLFHPKAGRTMTKTLD